MGMDRDVTQWSVACLPSVETVELSLNIRDRKLSGTWQCKGKQQGMGRAGLIFVGWGQGVSLLWGGCGASNWASKTHMRKGQEEGKTHMRKGREFHPLIQGEGVELKRGKLNARWIWLKQHRYGDWGECRVLQPRAKNGANRARGDRNEDCCRIFKAEGLQVFRQKIGDTSAS